MYPDFPPVVYIIFFPFVQPSPTPLPSVFHVTQLVLTPAAGSLPLSSLSLFHLSLSLSLPVYKYIYIYIIFLLHVHSLLLSSSMPKINLPYSTMFSNEATGKFSCLSLYPRV